MSLEKLKKTSISEAVLFRNLHDCLESTAEAHTTDIISILKYLDGSKKYAGIRGYYNFLAAKHYIHKVPKFTGTRKDAESLVNYMSIMVTGARPNEIIIGTKTQAKDVILRIHSAIVPPRVQELDKIREYDDLWRKFLGRLSSFGFFSDMSNLEKEIWLEEMQDEYETYLEDVEGLKVEVLQIAGDFLNLDERDIEKISEAGKILPITEIVSMFPKKPGSEGLQGRHTLIFRRKIWKVSVVFRETNSYDGVVIDVKDGDVFGGATTESSSTILLFDTFVENYTRSAGIWKPIGSKSTVGFLVPRSPGRVNPTNVWKIVLQSEKGSDYTQKDIGKIELATRNFTAASYKSLLQKIIRFRAEEVAIGSKKYTSSFVLKVCFGALLLNPGSFVPDIQRFVSGTESALKRMIVTLFEDAYISPEDESIALSITAGAFLAQRAPGWKPPSYIIERCIDIGTRALESPKAFVFDIAAGSKLPPYIINSKTTPLEVISALMEEIRSFGSDLAMIRYEVSQRNSGNEKTTSLTLRPSVMPLEHCVDQHWAPEIGYMYPTKLIYPMKSPGSKPFSNLFIRIFSEVTGVNPRRPPRKGRTMHPVEYSSDFEQRTFVKETRTAQRLTLLCRQLSHSQLLPHKKLGDAKTLKYTLDKGWISGMLGAVEVKGRPPALITLHPEDPEIFVAVRKPSRDMKDAFLDDEREAQSITEVKKRLAKGLPLNQSHAPIPKLRGAKLIYQKNHDDEFEFYIQTREGQMIEWDIFRQSVVKTPYIEDVPLTLFNAISYTGEGIVKNADQKLREVLDTTDVGDIRRAMMYLAAYGSEFEFARLGREGGGTKQAVSIHDAGAWQLTMKMSLLYPSALQRVPGNALRFRVDIGPLLWHARSILAEYLSQGKGDVDNKNWGDIGDKIGRVPWEHQTQSVEEMKASHKIGRKGHFIWIDIGLGKTYLILSYLQWLQTQNQLPKYIIYTLPSSAISSIRTEIAAFGFRCNLLVPLNTLNDNYLDPKTKKPLPYVKKGCEPEEYVISLIEHDHLRRCENMLPEYMTESIFIIDEVHKCLNETKRTSTALELSHIAQEFIALTGTPIIDSNTYKLIWWLEQIVPFEVNEKNFWVAANGMVAKRVNTGVKVDREDIEVLLNEEEEMLYSGLVPPSLGGKNINPRPDDLRKAMNVCYDASDRGIVKEIIKALKKYKKGVFVVARDKTHQNHLKDILLRAKNKPSDLTASKIFLISKDKTLFLTDSSVASKSVSDYSVVITTIRHSEGYTLTRLNSMITGVYPSNNATREQLEGRINRIGQSSDTVYYRIVHAGILTHILHRHNDARNLSAVLSALAEEINM